MLGSPAASRQVTLCSAGALCGKVLRFVLKVDMEASDSLVFSAEVDLRMMQAPRLGELAVRCSVIGVRAHNSGLCAFMVVIVNVLR